MIQKLDSHIDALANDRIPKVEQANQIIDNLNVIARVLRNVVIDTNPARQQEELQRLAASREMIGKTIEDLQKNTKESEGQAKLQNVADRRKAYIQQTDIFLGHVKKGDYDQAKALLFTSVRKVQGEYFNAVEELIAFHNQQAKEAAKQTHALSAKAHSIILAIMAVASVLSFIAAIFITRSITAPVSKTMKLAETLSKGDLTAQVEIDQQDEIGMMARAINATVTQLRSMITDISKGVETLASSSTELSAISAQMTQASQDTLAKTTTVTAATGAMSTNMGAVAAAMEQATTNTQVVATAAEQMSATIHEIAKNSEKATTISSQASGQASQASKQMENLGKAADSIGKVVETITEISEQVNLLALNATIEAARAGEAGKGFAVVANEIKELARLTASATQEIKEKVVGIQGTTSSTIETIDEIAKVINSVNEVVVGIASAVEEQSSATSEISTNVAQTAQGIQEVNQNVNQSSESVQTIAKDIAEVNGAADEMAASSTQVHLSAQNLSQLANKLRGMVNQFTY